MKLRERFVETNGIRLHLLEAGPEDGQPVILLHGFPDFWYGWRRQSPVLAAAGFRVFAPDQRGYNLSDKPPHIRSYQLGQLTGDVAGLIKGLGYERASVVGHDWGGILGWALAVQEPRRVDRLAVLNAPHPAVIFRFLRHDPEQIRRSWYVFLFQVPFMPEIGLRARGFAALARTMRGAIDAGSQAREDLRRYREAWSRPRALSSMLHWYRAAGFAAVGRTVNPRVEIPTLMQWGMQDPALSHRLARPSIDYCTDGRLVLFPDASHWPHHDGAGDVNDLLIQFLKPAVLEG
jgi:pimeloyl-ACP methyl ester carboxylesterase